MKKFLKGSTFVLALVLSLGLSVTVFADVGAVLDNVNDVSLVTAEVVGNSLVMELDWADAASGVAGSITITPVPAFANDGLTAVVLEPRSRVVFEAYGEITGTRNFAFARLSLDELDGLTDAWNAQDVTLVAVEPGEMETVNLRASGAYVFQLEDSAVFWMSVAGTEVPGTEAPAEAADEVSGGIEVITGGEEDFADWTTLPAELPEVELEEPGFLTPVPPIGTIPSELAPPPIIAPPVIPPTIPQIQPPVTVDPPVFVAPAAANTGVVYNCSFLNLRRGPGVNYPAFSYLAYGDTVTILDRTRWNWLQVNTHRGEGWVFGNYINEGAVAPAVVAPAVVEPTGAVIGTGVVYNASALNLRRGPGVNHAAFNHLPYGYTVQILERERWGWLRVSTPRGEGWVYGGYINEG